MTLLQLLLEIRERKANGESCDDALEELLKQLDRFRPRMRRMVKGQLADEDAILNASLYSILAAEPGFNGTTEAEAFVYCWRAVETRTLDHIRTHRGKLTYVGGEVNALDASEESQAGEEDAEVGDPRENSQPEVAVYREEIRSLVRQALTALTPEERDLIVRVEILEERIIDIAEKTGVRENTLTKRKNRALLKLRTALAKLIDVKRSV